MTWLTQITMGSLFDGIGGFPLAAVRNGITPVWASEIEAFPIEVTKLRFPGMIHVGDITKLRGAELPPVDIICGGSPCQDLSVAGARAGLVGARSGLFMEQMRIVREMRLAEKARGRESVNIRPRWMCWENVPGAFSSGKPKYEDFRIVLEEIVRICFPNELIRSVASASFSLLTLPGRSRPSFYLMYLTKRKTVRRRSHRCTDSIRPGR